MSDTQASKTLKTHLQNLLGAFVIVALTFGMIELVLRLTDPWGIRYFDDITLIAQNYEYDDTRYYLLPDGDYQFSNWHATIQDDVRYTPATNPDADCEIAFIGDSVTFGYGIEDDEVWVNVLAAEFPDVHFINTGVTLYAIENILGTYEAFPDADAYIYLITDNDDDAGIDVRFGEFGNPGASMPYLVNYPNFYLNYRSPFREGSADDTENTVETPSETTSTGNLFLDNLALLVEAGDVTVAGFPGDALPQLAIDNGFDVEILPRYPSEYHISFADVHLNAEGNQVLADYMRPLVTDIIEENCEA